MSNSSIWPINRTLSSATTPDQSVPGNDGNERVLHILHSSSITRASPSDCLASYQGHLLGGSYSSAEMQSVYSTVPADWVTRWESLTPLQRCSQFILQSQPTGLLVGRVLQLDRDAVSVFYSQCIPQSQSTGLLVGKVLHLYRDAVSLFYSPSRLGYSLGRSYTSAEMQSMYSTLPADWATRWEGLTARQRCSQCILQSQQTGLCIF